MNPNVKATASYIPGTTAWTMAVFEAADVPEGTKVQPVSDAVWRMSTQVPNELQANKNLMDAIKSGAVRVNLEGMEISTDDAQVEDAINTVLKHHKITDGVLRADLIAAAKKGSIE